MIEIERFKSDKIYYKEDKVLENTTIEVSLKRRKRCVLDEENSNEFYKDYCIFYGDWYGEGTILLDSLKQFSLIDNKLDVEYDNFNYRLKDIKFDIDNIEIREDRLAIKFSINMK